MLSTGLSLQLPTIIHELIYVALNPSVPGLWSHFSRQELYPFKTLTEFLVYIHLRAGSWDLEQKCLCDPSPVIL